MIRKSLLFILIIMVLYGSGCIKETYDMNKLSKDRHLSPVLAISAIKGNVSFSDMVKSTDTIVFDNDSLVNLIFKKDSILDLSLADFFAIKNISGLDVNNNPESESQILIHANGIAKALPLRLSATIEPKTLKLEIGNVLSNISGDFQISNPSINLYYSNSFAVPVKIKLNAIGKRKGKTDVSLNLDTFALSLPTAQNLSVLDTFLISKANSQLRQLVSLLPDLINFSGNAYLYPSGSTGLPVNPGLTNGRIFGRLELEIPLEFRTNNLVFKDTLDNFLKPDDSTKINPENFEFLRVDFNAKNGFPVGATLKMSLYNSASKSEISFVDAAGILAPAPVGSDGKVTGVTETNTHIEFTKEFFKSISKADKIIFQFTLNTTGSGANDVKIYSFYKINFNAAMVVKPDIELK